MSCELRQYGARCAFRGRCGRRRHPACYVRTWLAVHAAERGRVEIGRDSVRRVVRTPEQEELLRTWRSLYPETPRWRLADAQRILTDAAAAAGTPIDKGKARPRPVEPEGILL